MSYRPIPASWLRLFQACTASLLVTLAGGQTPAWAQTMDDARERYLRADFDSAATTFEAVLEGQELTPREVAEAHSYLAALRFMLGQQGQARSHAEAALALSPSIQTPEGAPTELRQLFDEVSRDLDGPAELRVHVGEEIVQGSLVTVRARLVPAPVRLAVRLELECSTGAGEAIRERGSPPEVSLRVHVASEPLRCGATAVSDGGTRLLTTEREFPLAPAGLAFSSGGPRPGLGNRALWIGVGVGAAALAVVTVVVLAVVLTDNTASIPDAIIEGW